MCYVNLILMWSVALLMKSLADSSLVGITKIYYSADTYILTEDFELSSMLILKSTV